MADGVEALDTPSKFAETFSVKYAVALGESVPKSLLTRGVNSFAMLLVSWDCSKRAKNPFQKQYTASRVADVCTALLAPSTTTSNRVFGQENNKKISEISKSIVQIVFIRYFISLQKFIFVV